MAEYVILGLNFIALVSLNLLGRLDYKEHVVACDYHKHSDLYLITATITSTISFFVTLFFIMMKEITASVSMWTAFVVGWTVLEILEQMKRNRHRGIRITLETLKRKYGITVPDLHNLLIEHGMQCLPMSVIEKRIGLTKEQMNAQVIDDELIRTKIEADVNLYVMTPLIKAQEYRAALPQLVRLREFYLPK